jgi:hypothetical protein
MEYKDLQKMTVKKLREEAQEKTQITGTSGMKKDELVDALAEALGIEKPKKEKKVAAARSKDVVKGEIKKYKDLRAKALEGNDKKQLKVVRFHIKRLKRELRRIAV